LFPLTASRCIVKSRTLNPELFVGLVLLAAGAAGFSFRASETGAVGDMAGSFFPRAIFAGLMATGAAIALRGFITAPERFAGIPLRSCAAVTASVVAFAVLIDRVGLAAAVVSSVALSTLGFRTPRLRDAFVFGVCLAAAMFVLFVGLLGQSIKLAPGF
jgi:hypothetical protein